MIPRDLEPVLRHAAGEYPILTLAGPHQSGKTTLVRHCFPDKPYFSLESPDRRAAIRADPRAFLRDLPQGAILDEIQRLPELLSFLQERVDEGPARGLFILTGSHQPLLRQALSQTLAGRTALLTLLPFSHDELRCYGPLPDPYELVVKGAFPRLHEERLEPRRFHDGYLQTYVERDLRQLLQVRDLAQFQLFLTLLAGRIGQLTNLAALSNDVGVSATTLRAWLSVLMASHLVFSLTPWHGNLRKRLVRTPKIYFGDMGLASYLLGLHDPGQARRDPLRGVLFENLVLLEVWKGAANRGLRPQMHFYRDSGGHEVDLLVREGGRMIPVEIKPAATFSPDFLKGLERLRALGLDGLTEGFLLYDGDWEATVRGTRVLNPMRATGLWDVLTRSG